MQVTHETLEMNLAEQSAYLVTLVHDEFLESVIAGQTDDYLEWSEFIHDCLDKLVGIPLQR